MDAIYRRDFASFVRRCFRTLVPGSVLQMNWHIYALAFALEQVRLGKIRRLIINMPPRSLKSLITSVSFPSFVLGHDPTKAIIVVSYGSDLAIKLANDCRVILNALGTVSCFRRCGFLPLRTPSSRSSPRDTVYGWQPRSTAP